MFTIDSEKLAEVTQIFNRETDPAATKERLERDICTDWAEGAEHPYQQRKAQMSYWQRECPECGLVVCEWDMVCTGCDSDLRPKCESCGLPIEGPTPRCQCQELSPEEMSELFRSSPKTRGANKVNREPGWLRGRRARHGY